MEFITPGESRPITFTGLPDGLVGQIGVRVEDSDDQVVVARTVEGFTEFATGNYRVWVTFPTTTGIYVVIADFEEEEISEEFKVTSNKLEIFGEFAAPTAADIRLWSKVPFAELGYPPPEDKDEDDSLQIQVERSISEFQRDMGLKIADIFEGDDVDLKLLAGEAIQMYTEWRVGSSQPELLESVYDFDIIQSFSAGNYSETRRGYGASSQIKHPWPRLNRLLSLISGDMAGDEVPAVSGIGSDGRGADWERQRYIMDSFRRQMPGFVYSVPWDGGIPNFP